MMINNANGGQTLAENIDTLRLKGLPGGGWELHAYPHLAALLSPHGAMHIEVPVELSEVERILRVAPHLFGPNEQGVRETVAKAKASA